jgi:hypothetical protein
MLTVYVLSILATIFVSMLLHESYNFSPTHTIKGLKTLTVEVLNMWWKLSVGWAGVGGGGRRCVHIYAIIMVQTTVCMREHDGWVDLAKGYNK